MSGSVEKEAEKRAIVCLFGPTNKAPEVWQQSSQFILVLEML